MGRSNKKAKKDAPLSRGHNAFIAIAILIMMVWLVTMVSSLIFVNHVLLDDAVDITLVIEAVKKLFSSL